MESTFKPSKKVIITYLILAFVPAYLLQGLIALLGIGINSTPARLILAVCMFAPALAVLLTKKIHKQTKILGVSIKPRFKGNIRWYLFALLVPTLAFNVLTAVLYYAFNPSQLNTGAPIVEILVNLVVAMGLSILIMPLTLGEEAGWRGFLYPALRSHTTPLKANLLCGLIWGLWHAPIIAQGYNMGTGYPFFPWLGIFSMCVFCFAFGTFLSYLAEKSGSLWPAVLGHGANNSSSGILMAFLLVPGATISPQLIGSVYATLPILALAFWLIYLSSRKAKTSQK